MYYKLYGEVYGQHSQSGIYLTLVTGYSYQTVNNYGDELVSLCSLCPQCHANVHFRWMLLVLHQMINYVKVLLEIYELWYNPAVMLEFMSLVQL